ncbi:hypothetical protein [Novosphingobium sp.]|uniref:hypothetical protein n=1 Tax=Novosphingobium sp. TaxID=1874826 RepID=UPI0025F0270E|nr:hypothetical protein [Novosphingobium sp.]MCC6926485.1 hypothetical protein [Novosphingobium sp.]
MAGEAHQSDMIIGAARRSLVDQRAGGRRVLPQGARQIRRGHLGRKLRNVALAVGAIWIGLSIVGTVIEGIGFSGLMLGALATAGAVWLFGKYPQMKMPGIEDLNPAQTDVRRLVGQTELWLEGQRAALPPPAVQLVDHIGLQLDVLGAQLAQSDQDHPKAGEVRKLVGEHLPGLVQGYRQIPEHLRYEERAGSSPNKQLLDGLQTISAEIDSVTRQLAMGPIDNLAIQTRYLEYKYGEADEGGSGPA